jgi:SAM-dependent methyltransferase
VLYFKEKFKNIDKSKKLKLIDIAPSQLGRDYLKKLDFLNYRSADLMMEGVDDVVDITDMKIYEDNSVDIFVCSHVLEHIPDDIKAMQELYRILKPGGWGIAMVPINIVAEEILEDPKIVTIADRWKYYGQDDHVRFYNKKGFVSRLESVGFKVDQLGISHFGKDVFEKNGIHRRSVLYIVNKL